MNEWKYRTFGFVYWFGIYFEKHNRSMSIVAIIMVHMFHLSLGKFAYLWKSRKKTIETINVDVFCEQNDQEENNTKNALKAFYKRCYFFHESLSNKLNGSNIIRMCFFCSLSSSRVCWSIIRFLHYFFFDVIKRVEEGEGDYFVVNAQKNDDTYVFILKMLRQTQVSSSPSEKKNEPTATMTPTLYFSVILCFMLCRAIDHTHRTDEICVKEKSPVSLLSHRIIITGHDKDCWIRTYICFAVAS